jgi:WD40 repeat protein
MERRYANADGLADDLEAWLEGMPLKAAPRTSLYVVSKWASRHRAASAVSLLLLATLIGSLLLLTQKNRQIGQALRQAEANNAETLRRSANESYLMGVTRERRRPVLGLAHWAHALRQDPQNQAALGMALSTLNHRRYPYVIAPATRIPAGKVMQIALSANAQWAAVVLKILDGEVLLRAQRGTTEATVHPIPADGRMTLLAVSNAGHVAVAAPRGPVGLLQANGTWKASVRDMEGLRFVAWTPKEQLWWVGVNAVARMDANGADVGKPTTLTGREWRSAVSEDGHKLAVGIEAGRIMLFDAGDQEPREIKAPIPAPFSALAVDATGERVAAAWRNGELWMHHDNGTTSSYRAGESLLHLVFMPDGASLLMHGRDAIDLWNAAKGGPGRSFPLKDPLKTLLPAGPASLLMQTTLGKPALQDLNGKGNAEELPGIEGRVHCTTGAGSSVLLVVDEDHQVIEWLATPAAPLDLNPVAVPQTWLALVPFSEPGHWVGINTSGDVCKVTLEGESTPLWQTGKESLRLASIDKSGTTALVDVQGSPGVFVSHRGERSELLPWGKPSTMALSPDARFAALGYPAGEVRVFDLASGRPLAERDWQRGPISAVTFVSGARLAVAASSQVRVWDWQLDQVLPTPIDLSGAIRALAPCSAGARLAATGDDATLHVIDVESGRRIVGLLPAPENCTALAWTPGDTHLLAFGSDSKLITVPMPPLLRKSPPWLPTWIEHHIGMKIDDQGRAERLRAGVQMPLPSGIDVSLKAWLLK